MAVQEETCSDIARSYLTLKLLTEYEESLLALTNNVSGYCQLTAKTYHLLKFKTSTSATKLKQKLNETVENLDVNSRCFVPEDSKATEKQKRDFQALTEAELNYF